MYLEKRHNSFYAFLIFLIWPFLSVIIAINEYRQKWAKNIIWFFTAFFAYSKVEPPGYYTDAIGYRISFEDFAKNGTYNDFINNLYTGTSADVAQPLLEYLVSRFTDNYQIYFLFIGIAFGYFYSRNIWFLFERSNSRLQLISIIILFIYALIIPIWKIGGFRFWLAAHVFVYGVLLFFISNNKKGLFLIGITFLIHYSFILPILIVISYLLLRNRITLYFIFFIFSTYFADIAQKKIVSSTDYLPEVFSHRVNSYTNEAVIEKRLKADKGNWYLEFSSKAIKFSSVIFLIILYWKRKFYIIPNSRLFSLFSFTLLFYSTINMIIGIPSMGRFIAIANMFSFALIFLSLQHYREKYLANSIYLAIPFLFSFFIVTFRRGFNSFGISTIIGNPIVAIFIDEENPLIDYIKNWI